MTGCEGLLLRREGRVLVLTIDRSHARNAIDHAVARGIAAAMEQLDTDEQVRVGVLTGAGGTFSAGMDLKGFLRGEPRVIEGRGFAGLTDAPPAKPLIAAVEGFALAGGFEIALACDLIIAAEDAVFGLPEVKRGLIAGSGGLLRLPRRIPAQIAMEHALTGEPIPAADAHRWGLVNRLVAPGCALAEACELAERIAANAPLAVRVSKEIVRGAPQWTEQEGFARQQSVLDEILASEDAHEGSRAFVERREPVWRGR
jgi:enoyl-CoA hydratase